ncbi:hypothetical protein [Emticicia fluvialis]|uniref:hypothetical protein n=1 Tax=Emticicia fluvialis TaxID=2974474 RepID=UPI0021655C2B|nr:hypothetical protein [Emticicia fluvialis]
MNTGRRFFVGTSVLGAAYLIYKKVFGGDPIQSTLSKTELADVSVPPMPEEIVPDGTFTLFETRSLPSLISGTNDIAGKNRLDFEVFPDTNGQPTPQFNCRFLWGNGVEFLNHSGNTPPIALQKGLATGFDNCFLNTSKGVPAEHRYKWALFNDFLFWQNNHTELEKLGAENYNAIKHQSIDSEGRMVPFSYTMLDIEAGVTDFSKISSFLKGYYNAAKSDNPKHVVILYSFAPNKGFTYWQSGYYYDGDQVPQDKKFFPYSKHSYNEAKAKAGNGIINNYFRGKDLMYNIMVSYPKVNLPITTPMYQKDAQGRFIVDSNDDRVLRNDFFEESQRGEIIRFSAAGSRNEISIDEGHKFGEYRLKPELYHAVNQFGGYYSEIFFRLQMLAKDCGLGDDFQSIHAINNPYQTIGILRHDLESNPFTNIYRPIDRITSEWHAALVYTLLNNLLIWSNVTGGNIGLTQKGAWINGSFIPGLHVSAPEGKPFAQEYFGDGAGQPKKEGHLGNYRQWAAKMYQMQAENRVYGLWQKTDKVLAFAHPEQIITGQFPAVGRLQGNILKLTAVESKLEIGESFKITIKNTKNSTSITKTIASKAVLNEVVVLPAGKYNAQDIYLEYTNPIKGKLQRVNGRGETL